MYISKLKLKNWKNFKEVDVGLSHRVYVVGPNASGKSNLLDAVRFLRDIVKRSGGLQHAVIDIRGGFSKIKALSARRAPDVSIEVEIFEEQKDRKWIYLVAFKRPTGTGGIFPEAVTITREYVWNSDKGVILDRKATGSDEDRETLQFTHLEQPNANAKFRELNSFFQEIQYLHLLPQLVRDSKSFLYRSSIEDYFGRNLLDRMSKINKRTREAYLRKISEVLQIAVPQLSELSFIREEDGTPHLQARYVHWRAQGAKQLEDQFSDGTLRLIGFLWALLDGSETILLEEPELHLHNTIIRQIPEFIFKLQSQSKRKRQVILTTHSYELLSSSSIGLNDVLLLVPTEQGTEVTNVGEVEEIADYIESGMSFADAVLSRTSPKHINKIFQIDFF